jgi:hypothetical protein
MSEAEGAGAIGLVSEAFKAGVEATKPKEDTSGKTHARGGPLVTLGRLYLSLVLILAVCASTSALVDWKTNAGHSFAIEIMRYIVLAFAATGLVGAMVLVWKLFKLNPLYLSSPSEMATSLQEQMTPKTPNQSDTGNDKEKAPTGTGGVKPVLKTDPAQLPAQPTGSIPLVEDKTTTTAKPR